VIPNLTVVTCHYAPAAGKGLLRATRNRPASIRAGKIAWPVLSVLDPAQLGGSIPMATQARRP